MGRLDVLFSKFQIVCEYAIVVFFRKQINKMKLFQTLSARSHANQHQPSKSEWKETEATFINVSSHSSSFHYIAQLDNLLSSPERKRKRAKERKKERKKQKVCWECWNNKKEDLLWLISFIRLGASIQHLFVSCLVLGCLVLSFFLWETSFNASVSSSASSEKFLLVE